MAASGLAARRANGRAAFAGVAGSLRRLHVGPIDDVATTGAMLLDAAAAPRAWGAP
jgi:predicted amidophosphoribosyltransferase